MRKIKRLGRNDDVLAVLRRGRKYRTPYALVYVLPSEELRFTCVVGKKVSLSAVKRHKIQRWLREAVREAAPGIRENYDIVVLAIPPIKHLESSEKVRQAVISVLKNL